MCRATADYADDPDHDEADQEFLNGFFYHCGIG